MRAAVRTAMRLRRMLASIVLSSASGCIGSCPRAGDAIDETIPVPRMLDPNTQTDLDICHGNANECDPLCRDLVFLEEGTNAVITECTLTTDASGSEVAHAVGVVGPCAGGRRPVGYRHRRPCGTAVGAYLAEQAALEHASIRAFEDLLADLALHGAPAAMRRAAVRAAADEVRHAQVCHALACRHGVTPRHAPIAAAARRTRRELAVDNAVEGCVRETFGAVVAGYQAHAASDPAIRAAMSRVWRDEARHAELSWQLHRWLRPRLDATDNRAVADAVAATRAELAATPGEHPDVHRVAGVPSPTVANNLLAQLGAVMDDLG